MDEELRPLNPTTLSFEVEDLTELDLLLSARFITPDNALFEPPPAEEDFEGFNILTVFLDFVGGDTFPDFPPKVFLPDV